MSKSTHRVSGYKFIITTSSKKEGLWTRHMATLLCPICKKELKFGFSGELRSESHVKGTAKGSIQKHLRSHDI